MKLGLKCVSNYQGVVVKHAYSPSVERVYYTSASWVEKVRAGSFVAASSFSNQTSVWPPARVRGRSLMSARACVCLSVCAVASGKPFCMHVCMFANDWVFNVCMDVVWTQRGASSVRGSCISDVFSSLSLSLSLPLPPLSPSLSVLGACLSMFKIHH